MVLAIQRKASARLKVFYFLQALQPKSVNQIGYLNAHVYNSGLVVYLPLISKNLQKI